MGLAFLVYFVNNLTVNSSMLGVIATIFAIMYCVFSVLLRYGDQLSKGGVPLNVALPTKKDTSFEGIFIPAGTKMTVTSYDPSDGETHLSYTLDGTARSTRIRRGGRQFIDDVLIPEADLTIQPATTNGLKLPKWPLVVCTLLVMYNWLMPNTETAKYMAGAYLLQSVAESMAGSEKMNVLGDRVYAATLRQVDTWAQEVPELKDLVGNSTSQVLESIDKVGDKVATSVDKATDKVSTSVDKAVGKVDKVIEEGNK